MKRLSVAALALFFLFTAQPGRSLTAPPEVSIIFTHDMHSHFDPDTVLTGGVQEERGGYARMSTVIAGIRSDYPGTFLLDGGDFSMGTAYQTIFSDQAPELRLMGRLGYDAVTLGNHEFDYRIPGLIAMFNASVQSESSLPQMLCANIDWERTLADPEKEEDARALETAFELYGVRDYVIINKNGVRAAIFGVMGKDADDCAPESGLYFLDPIEAAKAVVEEIKAENMADIIICLSHSGTNSNPEKSEDEQLALSVPDIDVIISGHTHTTLTQPIVKGNTYIVSCGENGYNIGHIRLAREGSRFRVTGYELIPIDSSADTDPVIEERISYFKGFVDTNYFSSFGYSSDQILTENSISFTPLAEFRHVQGEDTLGNLISDSYIYAVEQAEGDNYRKVDAAVVPVGVVRGSFAAGAVTVSDVFSVSSLGIGPDMIPGYPLVSVYLTGAELKTMAEIDISVSTIMGDARLHISGLSYTYNNNRLLLNRVTDVRLMSGDGVLTELDDSKLYRVVCGLYSCQMMGAVEGKSYGLLKVVPKDADGNPITDFEKNIVYNGTAELKEWLALARYLESFGADGIPQYYSTLQGRKIEETSRSPVALLKAPNKIFFMLSGAAILILGLLILVIVLIIRVIKKQKRKGSDAV